MQAAERNDEQGSSGEGRRKMLQVFLANIVQKKLGKKKKIKLFSLHGSLHGMM